MKTLRIILSLALTLCMLGSVSAFAVQYEDVDNTAPYAQTVDLLSKFALIEGENGTFRPDSPVTRAEAAKLLVNLLETKWDDRNRASTPADLSAYTQSPFADVAGDHWALGQIGYCAEKNIINGYLDGTFRPDSPVTYKEFYAMVLRGMGLATPADWANTLTAALQAGLDANTAQAIPGSAEAKCTRADCAEILANALFWSDGEYTDSLAYRNLVLPSRPDVYNLPYLNDGNVKHMLDIHYPETEAPEGGYPVLVMIRGGGFGKQTKTSVEIEDFIGVTEYGYAMVSIEYSDATDGPLPLQVVEAKAAIRFLRANAEDLKLNADQIFLSGKSAGAIISGAVGTTIDSPAYADLLSEIGAADVSDAVAGVILYYPQTDYATSWSHKSWQAGALAQYDSELAALYDAKYAEYAKYNVNFTRDPGPNSNGNFNSQIGGSVDEMTETLAMITANANIDENTPPFFIRHGTADAVLPFLQSVDFALDLEAAGIPVNFKLVEGAGHASPQFLIDVPAAEKVEWMNSVLAGK